MQRREAIYNLVIVQDAAQQDPADWLAIKDKIERDAPDIDVRIAANREPNLAISRWQVQRPSLVFSPCLLVGYAPPGGAVFSGQPLGKDEQLRRLASIGVPIPKSAMLSPASSFDPGEWGSYVIVKPIRSHSGRGVRLFRSVEVRDRYDEVAAGSPTGTLVQTFIDHSEDGYPTEYRVLTMLGRALYCARNSWGIRLRPLDEIAADPSGVIASNDKTQGGRIRSVANDADIIALGERAHEAFPECAILGVDIIRDVTSGKLYVLEVNPYGDCWHFSSPLAKRRFTPEHVRDLYAQFNALDRAAELLIDRTRAEAR